MNANSTIDPCNFVIFGTTGNLSAIKLLPAFYHLEAANRLPQDFYVTAFARREWGLDEWCKFVETELTKKLGDKLDREIFAKFIKRMAYVRGELHDLQSYKNLKQELEQPRAGKRANIIFYLSIKPEASSALFLLRWKKYHSCFTLPL